MQTEHVILLNAQGVPTGTLEKYAAHTADTLLHLAFSSWLVNAKGKLRLLNLSILTFATAPPIRMALWKMKCVRYLPHARPVRYRSTMMK